MTSALPGIYYPIGALCGIITVATACVLLYPLRGKLIRYKNPFDSVVEEDWETLR